MSNPEKQTIDFWLALNLAQRSTFDAVEAALKAAKLPPLAWFEVLFELEYSDGGLRPLELQRVLLFRQSNLSRLLKRMVAAGLVAEHSVPGDGRGKTVTVTDAGKKMAREMWKHYSPILNAARQKVAEVADADHVTNALRGLVDQKVLDHFNVD